ncbi:MAG: carboxypeptidase regulatory-like domain-containing protein [Acidobacteria bacterium]|nr:carboxypeptidase regulatory-like domain-containing protein [Acidobacteriota bacterium]
MKYSIHVFLLTVVLAIVACGKSEAPAPAETPAPAAETPAAAIDEATAATVMGKVSFAGTKPTPKKIRMDAEKYCTEQHSGKPIDSDEVVVNDNGTLANVFVFVKDGLGDRSFPAPSQPVVLDQKGCVYTPHVVGAMTGQSVDVLNSDETTHNVHPQPKNNPEWNISQPPKAEKITKTFAREELPIPVKCNVHPWMKSYILVVKHPFFGVTGADGSFTLKGLPPGDYTIAAWHEKYGASEQKVTLTAKDSKTVDFSFAGN